MLEQAAGTGQQIVVYRSTDTNATRGLGLTGDLVARVGEDAARRAADGWSIAAYDTTVLRSGGFTVLGAENEEPIDIAVTVVYRQRPAG